MVDVIVVGSGPAGMGVALNLLRAGREVLILECNAPGGQMATSPRLENIPGIKSISGVEYTDLLFEQIRRRFHNAGSRLRSGSLVQGL